MSLKKYTSSSKVGDMTGICTVRSDLEGMCLLDVTNIDILPA